MINLRKKVVRSLLPEQSNRLLDVGSGPIFPDYAYSDKANAVTCADWNIITIGDTPENVSCLSGDFTAMEFQPESYDSIIAADVFEHIQTEHEARFIETCIKALAPGGRLIVSVPHRGTFAWLDPYEVKPLFQRMFAKLGLYNKLHNGGCDIRKGHKHYTLHELAPRFAPLTLEKVVYWGHVFDPLLTWAYALLGEGSTMGVVRWLERQTLAEFEKDYGPRSFNMALVLKKAG